MSDERTARDNGDAHWQQSGHATVSGASGSKKVSDQITALFIVGAALIFLGSILFIAAWPHIGVGDFSGRETRGDMRWSMFGLLVNGVGGLFCSVSCVAWGVSLGYRHGRQKLAA